MGFFDHSGQRPPPPRDQTKRRRDAFAKPDEDDRADAFEALEPPELLLDVLKRIERCGANLQRQQGEFAALLQRYPKLRRQWQIFTAQGGQRASDFALFLKGRFATPIKMRRSGHLQLVSGN
jgi:hypothetical protein